MSIDSVEDRVGSAASGDHSRNDSHNNSQHDSHNDSQDDSQHASLSDQDSISQEQNTVRSQPNDQQHSKTSLHNGSNNHEGTTVQIVIYCEPNT